MKRHLSNQEKEKINKLLDSQVNRSLGTLKEISGEHSKSSSSLSSENCFGPKDNTEEEIKQAQEVDVDFERDTQSPVMQA